jgi:hypothetical protein
VAKAGALRAHCAQVFEEPRILPWRRFDAPGQHWDDEGWQLKRVFRTQWKMPGNRKVSGHFLKLWWPGTESNHRHADFQSAALPTELPGHEERKYIKGDYVAQVLFATFLL